MLCATVGEQAVVDEFDDDEDIPDACLISLPEPYQVVIQDEVLYIGVNSLHALVFGAKSELMTLHFAAQQLEDVVVEPWQPGPGPECLRSRQVSYTKKLNIPVPLAPKQCQVISRFMFIL
eukprot:GHRR01029104.1.p1 GENE.GHRR01029104.1~~GHRR01029104.1.p1  ORF type:complete len:120 (-),score=39.83 GHRR01029104.1:146-505(-)